MSHNLIYVNEINMYVLIGFKVNMKKKLPKLYELVLSERKIEFTSYVLIANEAATRILTLHLKDHFITVIFALSVFLRIPYYKQNCKGES